MDFYGSSRKDPVYEMVRNSETADLQPYSHVFKEGEVTLFSTGETSVHEWIGADEHYVVDMKKDVEEQLEEIL